MATSQLGANIPLVTQEEIENGHFVHMEWHSVEFGRIRKLYKSFLYPFSCVSTRFFRMHAIYVFLSDCTKEQALSSTEITFGVYGLLSRSLIYSIIKLITNTTYYRIGMFYTKETFLGRRSKAYVSVTASKLCFQGSHSGETSNSTLYKKVSPHVILWKRGRGEGTLIVKSL